MIFALIYMVIWSHYNLLQLVANLCNACDTTKILSWIQLHQHQRLQNSVPARIGNFGARNGQVILGPKSSVPMHSGQL